MSLLPEQITRHAMRAAEVGGILAKYGLADWLAGTSFTLPKRFLTGADGEPLSNHSRPTRLRMAASELGTTFVKLGQVLSTRPDLVGWEVAEELTKLQADAPPDPVDVSKETIATELGKSVDELFASFTDQPLASASIAQVHRATLHDGTAAVIKVQHPAIESRIQADLEILLLLAELAERSAELKRFQPVAIVSEFQRSLLRELDFGRELRNIQQFTTNFSRSKTVRFPRVFPELCTNRVLTMELLEGHRLQDSAMLDALPVNRDELARRGAVVWMDMIFRDGFYHADPHPGNLLIMADGTFGVMDCGMVGRIDEGLQESVEEILIGVACQDAPLLASTLMRICAPPPDFREEAFVSDLSDFISFYGSQPIEHFQLGNALNEIAQCISRYRLVLPSGIAQILKVLVMLDGTAKLLSPRINLIEILGPYQHKIALRQLSPRRQWRKLNRLLSEWGHLAKTLPRGLGEFIKEVQDGQFDVHLEHRHLEPSVNRLVMGMVTSALFLGSSLLLSNRVPPMLGDHSIPGAAGCILSALLGLRLIWKVWRNE
ncbi:MAG: ABC1 kinase family protein [Roseimicrobium sp.]